VTDTILIVIEEQLGRPGFNDRSDGERVTLQILAQMAGDIRAIIQLASAGLTYQAVTLAASTFERGMMLASIAGDDGRARKWLKHDNAKKNFEDLRSTVNQALTHLDTTNYGLKDALGDPYEGMYQALCAFKHANPLVQRHIGQLDGALDVLASVFPEPNRKSRIAASFALEAAVFAGWVSLVAICEAYVEKKRDLSDIINGLNRARTELNVIRQQWESERDEHTR